MTFSSIEEKQGPYLHTKMDVTSKMIFLFENSFKYIFCLDLISQLKPNSG